MYDIPHDHRLHPFSQENQCSYKKINPDRKKEILKNFISRSGVKVIGIKNYFTGDEKLSIVDKTFNFLDDLYSYKNFVEKDK